MGKAGLDNTDHCGANAASVPAPRGFMFGLIRLAILLPVAFVAGLLFERSNTGMACAEAGGDMRDGICWHE